MNPVRGRAGWPLPIPTLRAAWLCAATAPLFLAGELHPVFAIAGFVVLLLLLAAVGVDALLAADPDGLEAARDARPPLGLGMRESLVCEIRDRGGLRERASAARFVDDLPAGFERLDEPGEIALVPGGVVHVETIVRPRRRGRHALGRLHVRLPGPLGLAERAGVFDVGEEVRVLPGLGAMEQAGRILRRGLRPEPGRRRARRRGEGTAFESLRDHMPGEDLRKVDWKSSARHGRLIARQFEVERNQSLVLLVDCGRWMTGDVGGLSRLDRVLEAAILLAQVAAARDDRIGLLAFSDRVERYVPPAKGRAAVEQVVQAVFDLEPRLVESDYAKAFAYLRTRHRKRSLLVLFTDVLSKDASRVVAEEFRRTVRNHVPLCVALRDVELHALAGSVPAAAPDAYRQAAAEELLLEREHALTRMRRDGIHVLDADPRDVGPPLVERYLDLKARLVV